MFVPIMGGAPHHRTLITYITVISVCLKILSPEIPEMVQFLVGNVETHRILGPKSFWDMKIWKISTQKSQVHALFTKRGCVSFELTPPKKRCSLKRSWMWWPKLCHRLRDLRFVVPVVVSATKQLTGWKLNIEFLAWKNVSKHRSKPTQFCFQ